MSNHLTTLIKRTRLYGTLLQANREKILIKHDEKSFLKCVVYTHVIFQSRIASHKHSVGCQMINTMHILLRGNIYIFSICSLPDLQSLISFFPNISYDLDFKVFH